MEIYKWFETNTTTTCIVFFKRKEDCQTFINYLFSLKGGDVIEPKSTRNYSNYLGSFAFNEWPIIYPRYVLKEDVDNFIKLLI